MRIDCALPPSSLSRVIERAQWAERVGFDGVVAAETSHDPFLALAVSSMEAPSLDLETAIAVAFPRSPTITAHIAWDLAEASGGRFTLGLGSQVRAHITRRFGGSWESPVPRMREYIQATRAVWAAWQGEGTLRFDGDYYRLSLMTPFFNPGPIDHPDIPVVIAAVNPAMCRLAGELCQGLVVHPFHTVDYLDQVVKPAVAAGAERTGRSTDAISLHAAVMVVTGRDHAEMEAAAAQARRQIAFYASTPSYRRVVEHAGWDVGPSLSGLARQGRWGEMGDVIDGEMLAQVAVVAPLEELGKTIRRRYEGRLARLSFYELGDWFVDDASWSRLISAIRE
ncbi:MAG TPA: TIGR03617 family F420-dependent LLM class oxidoreductase [Acidimicrobiia bacterium]|nr:TIGR03617 family F420-dependent LLM class oxidoreductase [Acidimicrobiia bacterium]